MQYPLSPSHTKSEGFTLWLAIGWRNCVRFPGRKLTFLFGITVPTCANLLCNGYLQDRPQIRAEVKNAWSFTSTLHISHTVLTSSPCPIMNLCFRMARQRLVRQGLPISRLHDHTKTHHRTPLNEWSARRRGLYLTAHTALTRDRHPPPTGFEPAIPESGRPYTHALDSAANGITVGTVSYPLPPPKKWKILNLWIITGLDI